jgi:hypothetical protein
MLLISAFRTEWRAKGQGDWVFRVPLCSVSVFNNNTIAFRQKELMMTSLDERLNLRRD